MATLQQASLSGPKGQVHALAVTEDGLLFAGTQVSFCLSPEFRGIASNVSALCIPRGRECSLPSAFMSF